jgi:hypothetical protein
MLPHKLMSANNDHELHLTMNIPNTDARQNTDANANSRPRPAMRTNNQVHLHGNSEDSLSERACSAMDIQGGNKGPNDLARGYQMGAKSRSCSSNSM